MQRTRSLLGEQSYGGEMQQLLIGAGPLRWGATTLPAIAGVWTGLCAGAWRRNLREVFDLRQFIDESVAGEALRPATRSPSQDRRKPAIPPLDIHDFHFAKFDRLVAPQLGAARFQELRGS